MTITTQPLRAYNNYELFSLELRLSLPAHTGTEPVAIFDGANTYPLIDTNGQPVVSGELRSCMSYRVRYGSGGALSSGTIPAHFTVCDGLCCMEYSPGALTAEA